MKGKTKRIPVAVVVTSSCKWQNKSTGNIKLWKEIEQKYSCWKIVVSFCQTHVQSQTENNIPYKLAHYVDEGLAI